MVKWGFILIFGLTLGNVFAQELRLPMDFRQHNITTVNSNLVNPAFTSTRNELNSLAIWTRWQWQTVDGDPTTFLLSYSSDINSNAAFSAGFFQHNTGVFTNTGGILNYGHTFYLKENISIAVGVNIFGFQRELSDDRFLINNPIPLPQSNVSTDFIVQAGPGIAVMIDNFTFGLTSENLFSANLSQDETFNDQVYTGMVSYAIPLTLFGTSEASYVRPGLYVKSIPNNDTQFGINGVLVSSKFWAQAGYNNFYGIALGAGGRFFEKFSIGALVEFGAEGLVADEDPSFEIVSAYRFKHVDPRKALKAKLAKQEEELKVVEETQKTKDSITRIKETKKLEEAKIASVQRKQDSIRNLEKVAQEKAQRIAEQRKKDSITTAKIKAEEFAKSEKLRIAAIQQTQDSIAKANERALENEKRLARQRTKDSLAEVQQAVKQKAAAERAKLALEKRRKDSIATAEKEALENNKRLARQRARDSIASVKLAEEKRERLAEAEQRKDSIARAQTLEATRIKDSISKAERAAKKLQQQTETVPKTKGRYEEVSDADGLVPGYYLIANVFGTKKYFELFMQRLAKENLNPKSFYREVNNYNYVYLKRFDTLREAENARDTGLNGTYADKTWIFRVKN